jgi:hypothetical protein
VTPLAASPRRGLLNCNGTRTNTAYAVYGVLNYFHITHVSKKLPEYFRVKVKEE